MEFLYPNFLYALAALAIPIIVHLFNFRRFKKVPFTNVRFLREIKIQTQSQNKLRHLLVLLMRLLALAFLIFAFAQPFIPEDNTAEKDRGQAVSIFVDNSFSMQGESEAGPLLEVAKNRAIDIAMAYDATDRFQLLSQDFLGENQRFVSRTEFIENVEDLKISSKSRSLQSISERQQDLINNADADLAKEAYLISDFQKSQFPMESFAPDTSVNYGLVHLERNSPSNLYIDSVWFPTPVRRAGDSENLSVRIVNTGNQDLENVPLNLSVNGEQKSIGSFAVNAQSSVDTAIAFVHNSPGIKSVMVEIEDYPIDYDDAYYLGYRVHDRLKILSVSPSNGSLNRDFVGSVYRVDSAYDFRSTSLSSLNYSNLQNNDLLILNELLSIPGGLRQETVSFAENGGSVWIIPSAESDLTSYNQLLSELKAGAYLPLKEEEVKVRSINGESPLYRDIFESVPRNIDLPTAKAYYPISSSLRSSEESLLQLPSGNSFLSAYRESGGKIYVLAVPLSSEKNNFSRHAIFVATALRIAELSLSTETYAVEIGTESSFSIPFFKTENEDVFHLVQPENQQDIIPAFQVSEGRIALYAGPEISEAGTYELLLGDSAIAAVGFNFERMESDLASYSVEEMESAITAAGSSNITLFSGESENLAREVQQKISGTELWKICLILALAFLLLESILLRFGKRTMA
ncbi:MAG TPA: BatA domain-containing protein [Cryomorphaceae bacterium]|nr:BatA domain-containing protein [Cryomorphaceae bacterium]